MVDEMGGHADMRGGLGLLVMASGFKNDRGDGHAQCGEQAIGVSPSVLADEGMQRLRQMPRAHVHGNGLKCALLEVAGEPFALSLVKRACRG